MWKMSTARRNSSMPTPGAPSSGAATMLDWAHSTTAVGPLTTSRRGSKEIPGSALKYISR